MTQKTNTRLAAGWSLAIIALISTTWAGVSHAQTATPPSTSGAAQRPALAKAAPTPNSTARMKAYKGVWVEGSEFKPKYGGNYEACAKLCLGEPRCVMIEYYRPEKKCNRYSTKRKMLKGGSSIVAVKE